MLLSLICVRTETNKRC